MRAAFVVVLLIVLAIMTLGSRAQSQGSTPPVIALDTDSLWTLSQIPGASASDRMNLSKFQGAEVTAAGEIALFYTFSSVIPGLGMSGFPQSGAFIAFFNLRDGKLVRVVTSDKPR